MYEGYAMIDILKISLIAFMTSAMIQQRRSLFKWYKKLIKRLPWYLYFPLGGCYKCFTGQVMLWYYLIKHNFVIDKWIDFGFFIAVGIFLSMIYHLIYCWLDENR
jgi:hypothetical protein